MAYNPDVYNTTDDVKLLQQRIEDNFAEIVSNFSGTSEPSQKFQGMTWLDTSSSELKLKIYHNGNWYGVAYVKGAGEAVDIPDEIVTQNKIDAATRKPSIIEGSSISPSSCTLRAKTILSSIPGMASSDASVSKTIVGSTWNDIATYRVYVPSDTTSMYFVIRVRCGDATSSCSIGFSIGGSLSGTRTVTSKSFAWIPEVSASGFSTGWVDLNIRANPTGSGFQTIDYQGFAFRSA